MAKDTRHEIISFKVDRSLAAAMRGIPNRSAFIRSAILAALDGACPLCKGTGILTPEQRSHWNAFSANHPIRECEQCHAVYIACTEAHSDGPDMSDAVAHGAS